MARTDGPLLSLSASGSFADTLTFVKTRRGTNVRAKIHQSSGKTPRQTSQRSLFGGLSEWWSSPAFYPPSNWSAAPRAGNDADFSAMLKINLDRWANFTGPGVSYPVTNTGTAGGATIFSTGVDGHRVEVVALGFTYVDDWYLMLHRSAINGFTCDNSTMVVSQQIVDGFFDIMYDKEVPSGTWYYRLMTATIDGLLSAESPQAIVVV